MVQEVRNLGGAEGENVHKPLISGAWSEILLL